MQLYLADYVVASHMAAPRQTVTVDSTHDALDVMFPIVYEVEQMARRDPVLTIQPSDMASPSKRALLFMPGVLRGTSNASRRSCWGKTTCAVSFVSRGYG
jgi:hypothetical protein